MIVDEIGIQSSAVVDVIEAVSYISSDLDPGHPIRENGEIRVSRVSDTLGEVSAMDVVVNKVNETSRNRSAA